MQQKKITLTKDTHKFEILKLGFAMFTMVDSMIKNQQNPSGELIQNQKSQQKGRRKTAGSQSKIAKCHIVYEEEICQTKFYLKKNA